MKILYVEDNPMDVELTRVALAKSMPNAVITVATTLAEAKTALENPAAFDIVLSDNRLPDGSGLELLGDIRREKLSLPVVILTGLGDEETVVAALKSGADDYAIKRDGYLDELPLVLENARTQFHKSDVMHSGDIRVIYVEHNTPDADLARRHMARHAPHITLEIVTNADAVLSRLAQTVGKPCPWDVLLLDYRLPGLNALETLKIVRYEYKLKIPVIMVTGKGNEALATKALRLGASDYLVKRDGYLMQLPHALESAHNLFKLQRKQEALRKSEEYYRTFFENDLTADFVADPDGNLLDCNPAFVKLFGFESREQALSFDTAGLLPDTVMRERGLSDLQALGKVENQEIGLHRIDGSLIFVLLNIIGVFDETGKLTQLFGYLFNVTERKHFQEQFYQAQKMEALGHLAGGVAHDFNNLLVPIMGYAEMGMRNGTPGDQFYTDFGHIKDAAERAAQLTRQILAFGRRQVMEMTNLDLNKIVDDFNAMLVRLLSEDISLTVNLSPNLKPVLGDKGQLEQVLLNLVVNACDAMPAGGKMSITTENITLNEPYITTHTDVKAGQYVLLTVNDAGHGMDAETRNRIFEPFFSTKERGAGTGLGLSTVFGIVKQHNGNILVYSEPDMGTSVKVYLPVSKKSVEVEDTLAASDVRLFGTETVLVVEDNEAVRKLVCVTVESYGYHILEAAEPVQAIELAGVYQGRIDLLLTDLIMPDMNGQELYHSLVAGRPHLHALFMSGYTDDIISHKEMLPNGFHFVQKPFEIEKLLKKIREALR